MIKIAYVDSIRHSEPFLKVLEEDKSFAVFRFVEFNEIVHPENYDVIFVEYLGVNVIQATKKKHKNLIVRTNGVEVYEGQGLHLINYENITTLLALQQHQLDYFERRYPKYAEKVGRMDVLPLTVDFELFDLIRYPNCEKKHIALVANITGRKGTDQIPEVLLKYPEVVIHHLGKPMKYGHPVEEYVRWRLEQDGTSDRYIYRSNVEHNNLSEWLNDKNYIWLPSISEGFCRALLEGVAKGLTPIIRNWADVKSIYPRNNIYNSIDEIGEILKQPLDTVKWREYALSRYSPDKVIKKFKEFL